MSFCSSMLRPMIRAAVQATPSCSISTETAAGAYLAGNWGTATTSVVSIFAATATSVAGSFVRGALESVSGHFTLDTATEAGLYCLKASGDCVHMCGHVG